MPRAGVEKSTPQSGVPPPSAPHGDCGITDRFGHLVALAVVGTRLDGEGAAEQLPVAADGETGADRGRQPLVRIDREGVVGGAVAVRSLDALVEHAPATVGAVDVEPEVELARERRHLRQRIDDAGVDVAGVAHDGHGRAAGRDVLADERLHLAQVGTPGAVEIDEAQVAPAEAQDAHGASDHVVRLRAGVDARLGDGADAVEGRVDPELLSRVLASPADAHQVGGAAAGGEGAHVRAREAEQLDEPAHGHGVEVVARLQPPALRADHGRGKLSGSRRGRGCGRDPRDETGVTDAQTRAG